MGRRAGIRGLDDRGVGGLALVVKAADETNFILELSTIDKKRYQRPLMAAIYALL